MCFDSGCGVVFSREFFDDGVAAPHAPRCTVLDEVGVEEFRDPPAIGTDDGVEQFDFEAHHMFAGIHGRYSATVTDVQSSSISPRYPVVLFDLDNTLSDFTSAQAAALPALLADHGVTDGHEFLPTFTRLAAPLWGQLEAGELTLETLNGERFRLFVEHTGLDLDPAVLAPQYLAWLGRSGALWPGATDLLDQLHGQVVMGLVTNGYSEVQRPRLDKFELGHYFASVTVSSEIGHAKPSRAFFDVALGALGNPDPSTVLVVGDSLSSDIAGGEAAGCATCWFNPNGQPAPEPSTSPRIDHVATSLDDVATIVLSI